MRLRLHLASNRCGPGALGAGVCLSGFQARRDVHVQLLPAARPDTTPWWPSWSPDGKWIAVAMHGSIWKVDPRRDRDELTYGKSITPRRTGRQTGNGSSTRLDDGVTIGLEILNVETGKRTR